MKIYVYFHYGKLYQNYLICKGQKICSIFDITTRAGMGLFLL
nr:MAG TPA: hypothetical protein [Caudoviricetes sp.]